MLNELHVGLKAKLQRKGLPLKALLIYSLSQVRGAPLDNRSQVQTWEIILKM